MKREDDWIKEIDKKIIHYMWTIFLSMMISIITTLSVVAVTRVVKKETRIGVSMLRNRKDLIETHVKYFLVQAFM